ncbi:hypothetical protein BMS3Abin14_00673 [bacterium BMS3Abin14]|nr:hypothetical protein BMS3Abin14_00673 [bacterium BMS3Abin14]
MTFCEVINLRGNHQEYIYRDDDVVNTGLVCRVLTGVKRLLFDSAHKPRRSASEKVLDGAAGAGVRWAHVRDCKNPH